MRFQRVLLVSPPSSSFLGAVRPPSSLGYISQALLEKGIKLKTGKVVSGRVEVKPYKKKEIEVKIKEGQKHQVKLMMESLGYFVKSLDRIQIGIINKKGLARGQWRYLKKSEIQQLRKHVGL